jgi:hypothetical protein
MAVVTPTITKLGGDDSVVKVVWANMANGDTGAPFAFVQWADRTVHIAGTFGTGGTAQFKGSNNAGTSYIALTDPQGNAISKTAEGIEAVTEIVELARPEITAGDGTTSLTVTLVARRDGSRRGG